MTNLDLLRAVAVLLVVSGHTLHFFGVDKAGPLNLLLLGTLGVSIFFVHTSLVLMLSLRRMDDGISPISIPFLIRRCFRVYPLSMVVVLAIAALHLPLVEMNPGHFSGYRFDGCDILANLFLVQDFSFRVPVLGPLWSLAYEMQMYLVLPAIYLAIRHTRRLWPVLAMLAAAIIFATSVHFSTPNIVPYIPCFLAGVLAFQFGERINSRIPGALWPAFVVIGSIFFLLGNFGRNPRWLACLILGLTIPAFRQMKGNLIGSASRTIAKYSYGIYLSHFFVIWFAFESLAWLPSLAKWSIFFALLAGLPVALFHTIENPMIQVGRSFASQYREQARPGAARRLMPNSTPESANHPSATFW
jgi:peptidoglycan/LPS O-acetylase OafA/YrhL